ncbi:MAG: sortase [Ilumatobacteraceae bacterium]
MQPDSTRSRLTRRGLLAAGAAVPLLAAIDRVGVSAAPLVAATLPAGASYFTALAPVRIADTRPAPQTGYEPFGFQRLDANTIRVQVAGRGGVPDGATAAVLNVTAVNPARAGWVKVVPAGASTTVSNINVERPGQILANLVTVQLSSGQVDVICLDPLDVAIDVAGAYVPTAVGVAAGRFVARDAAYRVLDTRELPGKPKVAAGGVQRVDVSQVVPAGATAVVVNLTAVDSNSAGFWTAFVPGAAIPIASNVNTDQPGQTRANQAILPVGADLAINVFANSGGHLVVDVAGYYTGAGVPASTDGLFVPNTPTRALDTRLRSDYGRMYPGWVCEFDFAGRSQAQAAVINLTTTETRGPGFFTTYAARTDRPFTSNLNATTANQTIANHAIARTSTAGIAVFTQSGGHVIVDVAGYFTGTPATAIYGKPDNVPPRESPLPYTIQIPAIGNQATIVEGVGSNVVDAGYVGHWPGTALAGPDGHMVLFAHRTEHGGMWRNLHTLGPGSQVIITGSDGRTFTYQYVDRTITGDGAAEIYNAGLGVTLPSLSLVACSKTNFLPTDTRFRIVVNFTQISQT